MAEMEYAQAIRVMDRMSQDNSSNVLSKSINISIPNETRTL
jgi:hypothetical protein